MSSGVVRQAENIGFTGTCNNFTSRSVRGNIRNREPRKAFPAFKTGMDTPEQTDEAARPAAEMPRKSYGPAMRIVAAVSVVFGLGGIAAIIYSVGPAKLADALSRMSVPRFVVALVVYYIIYVFDAAAWRQIIPAGKRPSLWRLWKAAIAGASINQLMPGGNIGEPLKIMILKDRTNRGDIIASLIVWNFMHMVSTMGLVLIGAAPIFLYMKADIGFMLLYMAGAAVLGLPAALIIATFRFNVLSRLASGLARLHIRTRRLNTWQQKVLSIETNVIAIISSRPRDITIAFLYLMGSRVVSVSTAFMIIWALKLDIPVVTAIYIQMLNLAVNTLFSFVPARVGVVEWYNTVIFKALHFTPEAGLAVSIVMRIIQVVTTIIGVTILARPMLYARRHKDG